MVKRQYFFRLLIIAVAGLLLFQVSCKKEIMQTKYEIPAPITAPPMGWNSFDSYGVYLHEEAARANIEEMAKTYLPYGYEYFVIDGGWYGEFNLIPGTKYADEKHASDVRLNEYGLPLPSNTYFPSGLKPLIEKAHSLGLKFGLHLMRGIPRKAVQLNLPIKGTKYYAQDIADTLSTCSWCHYNYGVDMSKPGSQEYYNSLINLMAEWKIDFIKADDLIGYPDEILGFADAIENCDRDIVFSLSPGGDEELISLPYYRRANMLRISKDIWDKTKDIDKGFEAWEKYRGTTCDGFYPDLDMIPFGNLMLMTPKKYFKDKKNSEFAGQGCTRLCRFTKDEQLTFLTMRALAASPLFIGGDLPTMDDFSREILTNKEMLVCNRNGVMGFKVYSKNNIEVWLTPDKKVPGRGWIGIFNRSNESREVSLSKSDLSLDRKKDYQMDDVWDKEGFIFNGKSRTFNIAAKGVRFLKFGVKND